MAYSVTRHGNTRIEVKVDGRLAYVMERENEGRGFWALFPVFDGKRGARITTDQYSNDLIEMITSGLICGGHLAHVEGGFVVPAPADASDFYVSGTGYLCARSRVRRVLSEKPIMDLLKKVGPYAQPKLRPATLAEREAAGLDVNDVTMSAVFIAAEA